MRLLSRKKRKPNSSPLYNKIHGRIKEYEHRLAGWLNDKTAGMKPPALKACLFIFCLAGALASVCIIKNALTEKPFDKMVSKNSFAPKHIGTAPAILPLRREENKAVTRVLAFKAYMDSLARSPALKYRYDSITRERPGLMDSLLTIEQYYSDNKNNTK